jgi:hypothetical protein
VGDRASLIAPVVDSREMLVEYLRLKGFTAHASPNGTTALGLADARSMGNQLSRLWSRRQLRGGGKPS